MQALTRLGQVRVRRSVMNMLAMVCAIMGALGFVYMALDAAGLIDSDSLSWAGAGWR